MQYLKYIVIWVKHKQHLLEVVKIEIDYRNCTFYLTSMYQSLTKTPEYLFHMLNCKILPLQSGDEHSDVGRGSGYAGAGHGGQGGRGQGSPGGGLFYGNVLEPQHFGSSASDEKSSGGGILTAIVSNELRVDGKVQGLIAFWKTVLLFFLIDGNLHRDNEF